MKTKKNAKKPFVVMLRPRLSMPCFSNYLPKQSVLRLLEATNHLASFDAFLENFSKLLCLTSQVAKPFDKLPSSPKGYAGHGRANGSKKIIVFISTSISIFNLTAAIPTVIPRSQSVNSARELVGWQPFIHRYNAECSYSAFAVVPEYTQTYSPAQCAQSLFGATIKPFCTPTITISGSRVQGRNETDWLADYFGLPTDFESSLFLEPTIQNALLDIQYYAGLDSLVPGLYLRVHAPLVYTRWNLTVTEVIKAYGQADYDPGYFNGPTTLREQLLPNALAFLSGNKSPDLNSGISSSDQCNQSILFQKLQSSKIHSNGCEATGMSLVRLSDIEFALGLNFIRNEDYLVGFNIRASAPTGNRICDKFFFAPLIGDGHHGKFGLGVNAQAVFWRSSCENNYVAAYLDARAYHLFKSNQVRTFDLCQKPNSRYMLAQRLGEHRLPIHITGAANAGVEFQNEFAPIANLTRTPVTVEIPWEGDVSIKVSYITPTWSFDLGYNYWARSCEQITRCCRTPLIPEETWALKGDAFVAGFSTSPNFTCVRLAAAQKDATLESGSNNFVGPDPLIGGINHVPPIANPGITNPVELTASNAGREITTFLSGIPTRSSKPVPFLTEQDVDISGIRGLSQKLFTHISYAWSNCSCIQPFLGIGAELEFTTKDIVSSCDVQCPGRCNRCTGFCQLFGLDQWGFWLKGGIAFN